MAHPLGHKGQFEINNETPTTALTSAVIRYICPTIQTLRNGAETPSPGFARYIIATVTAMNIKPVTKFMDNSSQHRPSCANNYVT